MSGIARTSDRAHPRTGRRPGARALGNEHRSRRHGGDFSHLGPILPESNRSPSPVPDNHKDLPRIPSTSTGLWGDEAVTILTEEMGTLAASPTVGCPPLPLPSHHAYERVSITEAQQIAAQYRQRFRSSLNALLQSTSVSEQMTIDVNTNPLESLRASPTSTVVQSGVSTGTQAIDAPVGAPLVLSRSPTRQALEEIVATHIPHEGTRPFSQVREDGTVSCSREDCLAVLRNLGAFLCHVHIHLIHEGLSSCEHCGIVFTDDDHKDDHLNSCPKLPTFHEIGNFEPSGALQDLLRRVHL